MILTFDARARGAMVCRPTNMASACPSCQVRHGLGESAIGDMRHLRIGGDLKKLHREMMGVPLPGLA